MATVQTFFKTQSETDLLGCYAWNQAMASALLPLLSDFKVALRNALHRALSQYYGGVDSHNWMLPVPNPAHLLNQKAPPVLPSQHAMGAKSREQALKAANDIKVKKHNGYKATPDDVVAALNFGFWEVLISSIDHQKNPSDLQLRILSAVFPHAPVISASMHGTKKFKDRVVELLKRVREVRNRIGHHDALWAQPEFDEHGKIGFIPRKPKHSVNSFISFSNRVLELMGWIDAAMPAYIQKSDHWERFDVLLSRRALEVFRSKGGESGIYKTLLDGRHEPENRHCLKSDNGFVVLSHY